MGSCCRRKTIYLLRQQWWGSSHCKEAKLKLSPKLKPIHKPGMHTPDTTHTLTDAITDMPVTDILPTPMDTDMVDIHTHTADTTDTDTTENRFLVADRILDRSLFKAGVTSHQQNSKMKNNFAKYPKNLVTVFVKSLKHIFSVIF